MVLSGDLYQHRWWNLSTMPVKAVFSPQILTPRTYSDLNISLVWERSSMLLAPWQNCPPGWSYQVTSYQITGWVKN